MDVDVAAAKQTIGLASQLDEGIVPVAPVLAIGPSAGIDRFAVVADVMADLQQQRDGKLTDGAGAVHRDVAHRDPLFLCVGNINDIVTGGLHRDELQVGAGVNDLFRNNALVCHRDVGITDTAKHLFLVIRSDAVIHRQLAKRPQGLPTQITGVLRVSVCYYNLHHNSSLLIIIIPASEYASPFRRS